MHVRVVQVTSPSDRESIYRFRYRIFTEELGKELPGMDHVRRCYISDLDAQARLLAAVDEETGAVAGTIRCLVGSEAELPEDLVEQLALGPMLKAVGRPQVSHTGALMVDPAYRGRTVASLLISGAFRLLQAEGVLVDANFAELALLHVYQQLGWRPYAPSVRPSGQAGLRVPLVLTMRDRHYLRRVASPLQPLVPAALDDGGVTAKTLAASYPDFRDPEVRPTSPRALWARLAAVGAPQRSVVQGLDEHQAAAVLTAFPTVNVPAGESVYQAGERERGMGVLAQGRLGVTLDEGEDPHLIAILEPGELFGEMAGALGAGRTARIVALEDSVIALLPEDALDRFEAADVNLGRQIRSNVFRVVCDRLRSMNTVAAGQRGREEESVRRTTTSILLGPTGEDAAEPPAVSAAEDREAELERLELQARADESIESEWLPRLGLTDGGTLLDLGSGLGVTSLLLARLFPRAQVIGIEPDDDLRARAEESVEERGLTDRCCFLAGEGEAIPLEDGAVDHVYARLLLQRAPRPLDVLREVRRVLRPGGVVVLLDVDDGSVVVHPEPPGLAEFQRHARKAQRSAGGDRHVGRKLCGYLRAVGFSDVRTEVVPVTSGDLPGSLLVKLAFDFKTQALQRAGLWDDQHARTLMELREVPRKQEGWLMVPVFFAHGRQPAD